MREHFALADDLRAAGAHVLSAPLQPTSAGASVEIRAGDRLVTDGPFAETKEQLGGYYVVDVDSIDEAIKWAAKIPSAQSGSIEVRPVMVFDREEVNA